MLAEMVTKFAMLVLEHVFVVVQNKISATALYAFVFDVTGLRNLKCLPVNLLDFSTTVKAE